MREESSDVRSTIVEGSGLLIFSLAVNGPSSIGASSTWSFYYSLTMREAVTGVMVATTSSPMVRVSDETLKKTLEKESRWA